MVKCFKLQITLTCIVSKICVYLLRIINLKILTNMVLFTFVSIV